MCKRIFRKKANRMKGKKILSAFAAGAMLLGTFAFPAFAEGEEASSPAITTANTADVTNTPLVTMTVNESTRNIRSQSLKTLRLHLQRQRMPR